MRKNETSITPRQGVLPLDGGSDRRRNAARPCPQIVHGLVLTACTRARAREAAKRWHYLGTVPAGTVAQYEAAERGRFIGAVVFGSGPRTLHQGFGCAPREACELIRVALDRHDVPVSRIVAVALRTLRRDRPHLRLIVSYADAGAGHHGGIYQAGGWTYTGGSPTHAYRIHGRNVHPRNVGTAYGTGGQSVAWLRANVDPDAARVATGVKHRYLLGLDAEMRSRVAAIARPFPRRAKQAMTGSTGTAAGRH